VLSRLSALTAPTALTPTLDIHLPSAAVAAGGRSGHAGAQGEAAHATEHHHQPPSRQQPQQEEGSQRALPTTRGNLHPFTASLNPTTGPPRVYLPSMATLWCHPPAWRLTDGSDLVAPSAHQAPLKDPAGHDLIQPPIVLHPALAPAVAGPPGNGSGAVSPAGGSLAGADGRTAVDGGTTGIVAHGSTAGGDTAVGSSPAQQQQQDSAVASLQGQGEAGMTTPRAGGTASAVLHESVAVQGATLQEPLAVQGPGAPAVLGSPGRGATRRRLLLPCIVTPSQ
jgi:hypothetical protein